MRSLFIPTVLSTLLSLIALQTGFAQNETPAPEESAKEQMVETLPDGPVELRMPAGGSMVQVLVNQEIEEEIFRGGVGKIIRTKSQAFRLSYGYDLEGSLFLTINAKPERKDEVPMEQEISVTAWGLPITLKGPAFLTVYIGADALPSSFKSSYSGTVTVGDKTFRPAEMVAAMAFGESIRLMEPVRVEEPKHSPVKPEFDSIKVVDSPELTASELGVDEQGNLSVEWIGARKIESGGTVTVAIPGSVTEMGDFVPPQSGISTGKDSYATLEMVPGCFVYLGENSLLALPKLVPAGAGKTGMDVRMNLERGTLYAATRTERMGSGILQVLTPMAAATLSGANFSVETEGNTTTIRVYQGTLSVTPFAPEDGKSEPVEVPAMHQVVIEMRENERRSETRVDVLPGKSMPENMIKISKLANR